MRVKRDLELTLEGTGEQGVQKRRTEELELEIFAVLAQHHALEQNRCRVFATAEGPLGEADAQCDCIDAAHRTELGVLGDDGCGRYLRLTKSTLFAHEVRQQSGLAQNELRQSARMRLAQVDACAWSVVEVQQRRRSTESIDFAAPGIPHRLGDVHRPQRRIDDRNLGDAVNGTRVELEIARHENRRHGFLDGNTAGPGFVLTPHTVTLRVNWPNSAD